MENLIMNSQWAPGPGGGPQYFAAVGPVTYDKFSVNGYRSCSITLIPQMMMPMTAQDFYTLLINVSGVTAINWGFTIRKIDADYIALAAEFFDGNMNPVRTFENPVTNAVSYEFMPVVSKFMVPFGAANVRLSIKFAGSVTACTYYAPVAYYA